MQIRDVEGINFRCFSQIKYTFPENGLTMIDGVNLVTGRSNMVGKTSLLDLVMWVLYGWIPRWDTPRGGEADNVIKRETKGCKGRVRLIANKKEIVVERSRPQKLEVWVDGKPEYGKSKDLQKTLEGLLGMDADQFLLSVLFSQSPNRPSFFLANDAKRTECLSTAVGLAYLDRGLERAKKKEKALKEALQFFKGKLSTEEALLASYPSKIDSASAGLTHAASALADADQQMAQAISAAEQARDAALVSIEGTAKEVAAQIQAEIAAVDEQISSCQREINSFHAALSSAQAQIEPEYAENVQKIRSIIADKQRHNRELERTALENQRLEKEIAKELDLAEAAQGGVCNHCKQSLPEDRRQEESLHHLQRAQELQSRIRSLPEQLSTEEDEALLRKAEEAFASRRAELAQQPNAIRTQLLSQESVLRALSSSRASMVSRLQSEARMAENRMAEEKQKVTTAQALWNSKVASLKKAVEMHTATLDSLIKAMEGSQAKVEQVRLDIANNEDEMLLALDEIDLYGSKGYRAVCFEDIISRISSTASDLISRATDGIYSTRLDQIAETASGDAKLVLKPVIIRGGIEVPKDDLSGAALKTYILAYDVALALSIVDDAPLFMDEILDGMDEIGKTEALRILEEVAQDRPVFIIDHTSQIKSAIPSVIRILRRNDDSWIEGAEAAQEVACVG